MDPYMSDPTVNQYQFYNVPPNAHSATGQQRSSSPPRDQRSYTSYSNQFPNRGTPYPFYSGLPGAYPPHHKGPDQRIGTQYQSSSSRPPDIVSRSVEVTRAGPAQALSSIVPSPTSQIITSHRTADHSEPTSSDSAASSSSRRFSNVKPSSRPRGNFRGSPRSTPSLIKAEPPTTLGASMVTTDCFSTAEEPVPYALTDHPIFSEDLKKACTPIRKVENPFASQRKAVGHPVYRECDIQRYRNDVAATSSYQEQQNSISKFAIHPYPNGVKDLSTTRSDYSTGASSSNTPDKQGGALDLSIKTVRQSADSTAPELDVPADNAAIYLGRGPRDSTKQMASYGYPYSQSSTKRPAEEYEPSVSRKYLKTSPSPNHVLPRQPELSRDVHATGRYSLGKVAEHGDLRAAHELSSFTQAHASLTMPYGRQVQSANSSGYFSEGISDGISCTPPISPRIRPPLRGQESERAAQKLSVETSYSNASRPNIKNYPYNLYSGQFSSILDRNRTDESLKYNSQSSYSNSSYGYYQGYPIDRCQGAGSVSDNSIPYKQSTFGAYGKTVAPSVAERKSYEEYVKNTTAQHLPTDQKAIYPPQYKKDISPRIDIKRSPKIEIATQPINLVEDNEISIEKTQNNTISFENFSHTTFKKEPSTLQIKAGEKEFNDSSEHNDGKGSKSHTPTNIIVPHSIQELSVNNKQVRMQDETFATNTNKICDQTKICKSTKDNQISTNENENDAGKLRQKDDSCNILKKSSSQEGAKDISNIKSANVEKTIYGSLTADCETGDLEHNKTNELPLDANSSATKPDPNISKHSPNKMKDNNLLSVQSTLNVQTIIKNNEQILSKIKEERTDIKCESEQYLDKNTMNNSSNNKYSDIEMNKVHFSDNIKKISPSKIVSDEMHGNQLSRNRPSLNSSEADSSLFLQKSETIEPVLNLSLATNQSKTTLKVIEDIQPRPISGSKELSINRIYQTPPISNYDTNISSMSKRQQNNSYNQRNPSNYSVTQYNQAGEKLNHPNFHADPMSYNAKLGMNYNKNIYHSQAGIKTESYSNFPKHNIPQVSNCHATAKNPFSTSIETIPNVSSSKHILTDAKDVNVSYSVADSIIEKSISSKQVPLAINPRVLSPWNSSIPHSLSASCCKPTIGPISHQNNYSKEKNSQVTIVKEGFENEKKLRQPSASPYPHSSYGSPYAYLSSEAAGSSYSNTQPERPQSYGYDSKSSIYSQPTRPYTTEPHNYKPHPSPASIGNIATANNPFNSSPSSLNRPLLSPHSPSHPPPPRLETSHQSLYYPTTYNTTISPRAVNEQYSTVSPHHYTTQGDTKYLPREFSPYPYKDSYPQQSSADRNPYPSPSAYYSHPLYTVSSPGATHPGDYSKQSRYTYANEQHPYAKMSPDTYIPERSQFHPPVGSYPSSSANKEYVLNRSHSASVPPQLSHSSIDYKPATTYENLQQMTSAPRNNMAYQYQADQKTYLHPGKSSQPNPIISSSYSYSTPKISYQVYPNQSESTAVRTNYDGGQYAAPINSRNYVHPSAETNKVQYQRKAQTPNPSTSYRETSTPKTIPSGETAINIEKTITPSIEKYNNLPQEVSSKNNNGKSISNPVQPLYSSWGNYKTSYTDPTNKQGLKPRSLESLQNAPQKYPSFKTEKDSNHLKSNSINAPYLGKIHQPTSNNSKAIPMKDRVPFSRPDYSKVLSQQRSFSHNETNQTETKRSSVTPPKKTISAENDFDEALNLFEEELNTNKDTVTSKKSLILAKRYAHRLELHNAAESSGVVEEQEESETESEAEPPSKFRGKYKSIKNKKMERLILTYASHSDDSATEMIADDDESDFEEELVKEIQAKARKGRVKDKVFKETPDDSDVSSAELHTRSSKRKRELSRHSKSSSSNNSSETSSNSSEASDSSSTESLKIRTKKKHSEESSSEYDMRKTRNTRSKRCEPSKELNSIARETSKRLNRRRLRRTRQTNVELSDDGIKRNRLRIKDSSSNSDDSAVSSTDSDAKFGHDKGSRLLLDSDTDEESEKNSSISVMKDPIKDPIAIDDEILSKLEEQQKQEMSRLDVMEMKAWKEKTGEQAVELLKSLPKLSIRHSWKRPSFAGVFKRGWQAELRKYKLETIRTPKQLVSVPPTPVNLDKKRGRCGSKSAIGRGSAKSTKDGLYSKTMLRRFFDKVLSTNKDEESLSRSSSSPFSTFTPTGLTPTPSVTPSMLVTGMGSHDSDKDSLISLRGPSPPASDSATLRRRSIATTIIQKIQRQQYKNRSFDEPWLRRPRSVLKSKDNSVLGLPRSLSCDAVTRIKNKKTLDVDCIRSVFGGEPMFNFVDKSAKPKNKYLSPISSSTISTASSTPSTPLDADDLGAIVAIRKRKMKKFRSGFDYIPKKKKKLKSMEEVGGRIRKKVAARRRRVWPENSRDVASELKMWVINKGLGETVIHRAARLQYHDIVIYCLEGKEINVNARDNAGYTPLHEACNRGHLDVAQALCAFGAHVNAPGYGGMRPLHEACDNGHVELVRLLLSFGADINLTSYAGQSCLSLASDSQCGPFIQDFLTDLRGKKTKPWTFNGPSRQFDLKEQGADFFVDEPPENGTESTFLFESSEKLIPDTYIIDGFSDSFVLLNELMDNLNYSYNDLIKYAGQIKTIHLTRKEFKKKSHCRSANRNDHCHRNGEVVLVKYTKRLQNMLGIEFVTVT